MSSQRSTLEKIQPLPDTHAGLWLDRFIGDVAEGGPVKQQHFESLFGNVRVPAAYPMFFRRWRKEIEKNLPLFTVSAEAEVQGRMVVGLGAESVLETSVALHRAYGVPWIPGSALKGLAAAAAHRWLTDDKWRKPRKDQEIGEFHKLMFGDTTSSGYVTFHDALWIPDSEQLPLDLDVMTVHHPEYYGGKNVPPAEWDSPNPVSFLTARGKYLLAVTGPRAWAETAMKILAQALAYDGVGAKTAAGYGRLKVEGYAVPPPTSGPSSDQSSRKSASSTAPAAPSWSQKVKILNISNADQQVPTLLESLQGDELKRAAAAVIAQLGRKDLKDKRRRDKPWVQRLFEIEAAP
jgi:CRISPR-associated protein Cmr6